jgi:hypothetical protein
MLNRRRDLVSFESEGRAAATCVHVTASYKLATGVSTGGLGQQGNSDAAYRASNGDIWIIA